MTRMQFAAAAQDFGVVLDAQQLAAFEEFEQRLYKANEITNFTRVPREQCRERHFLDSLSLSPLIPEGASVIDIGTGAGFPGVPLAIARPDLRLTLLDAATKEIRFLETLQDIASFGLIIERAEIAARDKNFREKYDVTTGRAFAALPIQMEISAALTRVGGLILPQRTEGEETPAFAELGLELADRHSYEIAGTRRMIPVYRKTSATPSRFPRTWASMKRHSE